MSEKRFEEGEFSVGRDDYLFDGYIRRVPHEFDVTEFEFYSRFLEAMDFRRGQVVADIGAGMGRDSDSVAVLYGPQIVYMVEPRLSDPNLIDRYYPMSLVIQSLGDWRVNVLETLPEAEAAASIAEQIGQGFAPHLDPNVSYLQPVEGRAEELPFPARSLDRAFLNHAIYAFRDPDAALANLAEALKRDGVGGLITNGPGDKTLLKQKMEAMKSVLERDAPEEAKVEYEMPRTHSSKIDYYDARAMLKKYFNKVILFSYHARMKLDADRKPVYNWGFDSYAKKVEPPVINYGRWRNAREEVYGWPAEDDPEYASHIGYDTIDIGWILFSDPKI